MPAPNRKQRKATGKYLDRLTALFIHDHPGILKEHTKEVIRDFLLNMELSRAFARLDHFEGSNK